MSNLEVVFGELLAQNALAARRSEIENLVKSQMSVLKDEMKEFKDEFYSKPSRFFRV